MSVDKLVEWFKERYEAPERNVPVDYKEGGYVYPGGGPATAEDVLRDQFSDVPEQTLRDAISRLEDESYEWVKLPDFEEEGQ